MLVGVIAVDSMGCATGNDYKLALFHGNRCDVAFYPNQASAVMHVVESGDVLVVRDSHTPGTVKRGAKVKGAFKSEVFENITKPVSYTHLTLPTTPYV